MRHRVEEGGELSLGPPYSPRPGSVPAMPQWFMALVCLKGDRIQDIKTTSIPNPNMWPQNRLLFWAGPLPSDSGSCPGQRGLVFCLTQSKIREGTGGSWAQLSLEYVLHM